MKHITSLRSRPATAVRLVVALVCAITVAGAWAAPCRSQTAATRGGQAGYDADKRGADQTEQQDRSASDILGRCVAGVTGVVTIPTFPSLAEVFEQIKSEICRIASQQVHQAVGGVSFEIENAMRGIPMQGQVATMPATPVSSTSMASPTSPPSPSPDFWQRIWR
jgi:septal ring-binding cell division protein DamX